jgi:heat shock protein HslJ
MGGVPRSRPPLRQSAPALRGQVRNGCSRVDPVGLENAHWKLTRLGGRAMVVGEGQGEPHLVLRTERQEANGSGGCNRLFGGYRLEGGRISFSGIATTRMSCPAGMEIEREFLRALAEAMKTLTRYRK